jgi:hypothetical protein
MAGDGRLVAEDAAVGTAGMGNKNRYDEGVRRHRMVTLNIELKAPSNE